MRTKWRFRCYPTPKQREHLAKTFGCVRLVYNWALNLRGSAYREEGRSIGWAESDRLLTQLKKQDDYAFLNEVSCIPLQQALRHLQSAFVNFFHKRTKYPSFKKKTRRQSATYSRIGFRWNPAKRELRVAKIGRLKVRWSREVPVPPSSVIITKSPSGRYHVTLSLDIPEPQPLPKTGNTVGIDLGINHLATLSTGEQVDNPRHAAKHQKKLARLQRSLCRRVNGSKRYQRQRVKVAKLHERIADTRKDALDKLTGRLVHDFDVICIEGLNVNGMMQTSLRGPVADAAFGMFRHMIQYKAARAGKTVQVVDRFFPSSRLCSQCGHKNTKLQRGETVWTCPECGTEHDRDLNAAINLLAAGHAVPVRGGSGSPGSSEAPGTNR